MSNIGPLFITIAIGIIGLAMASVIFSKNAQTPQVFQAGGTAFAQIIGAAVAPVSGANNFGAVGQTTAGTSG
jgi:hypothetical protein